MVCSPLRTRKGSQQRSKQLPIDYPLKGVQNPNGRSPFALFRPNSGDECADAAGSVREGCKTGAAIVQHWCRKGAGRVQEGCNMAAA